MAGNEINSNNYVVGNENSRSGLRLLNDIELNYSLAEKFYLQRKMAFLHFIIKDAKAKEKQVENALVDSMNLLITDQWKKITSEVLSSITLINNDKRTGKFAINEKFNDNKEIPLYLKERILQHPSGNIYSLLGLGYEDYLYHTFKEKLNEVANNGVQEIINQTLALFEQTGALTTTSALRPGKREIRPDLAIGINKDTVTDENGLSAELTCEFNIESYRKTHGLNNEKSIENNQGNILQQYIESNMFGFSVKRWMTRTNPQKLTSASEMKNKVQAVYNRDKKHTWNSVYAYRKMAHIVSQYLIDILGPVNIGYITGLQFEWANDFLAESLLTMNIYSKKAVENNEILQPYVNSGNIYIQYYKRGRQYALNNIKFSRSYHMATDKWDAYQLQFTVHGR